MRGVALIPALIGTLILTILIATVAGVVHFYTRETQSLSQKLEIIQIQQALFGVLNTPAVCACNMDPSLNTSNSTPLVFNSSNPATARISFDRIFSSCAGNTPSDPILNRNQPPSGSSSGVRIRDIALENIQSTGTPGSYYGELTIGFTAQSLVMGRRPAKVGINFRADVSNPGQARITACSSGDPNGYSRNPPGTAGANCGTGNQGLVLMRATGGGGSIPVCCTVSGTALSCTPI